MFHTPRPPHVLTTLQVECVACKQSFLVAETDPNAKSTQDDQWRLVSSAQSYVSLRYTEDSVSQPTKPPPRPHTQRETPLLSPPPGHNHDDNENENENKDNALNCPRCGADNRNWLRLWHVADDGRSFPWLHKFRPAALGLALVVLLTLILVIRSYDDYQLGDLGVLAVAVLLAGALPCYFGTKAWPALRDYKNSRGYLPKQRPFSPPLRNILIIGAIFIVILPGFLYVVMPLAFDVAGELISPTSQPTLPQRINNVIDDLGPVLQDPPDDKTTRAEDAVGTLERLLRLTPGEGADLHQRSQVALAAAREAVKQWPESELTADIAAEISTLEKFINDAKPPRIDTAFLKTWFKYTLTSHVLASLFALLAVSQYVGKVNRQLPRPIFHSVSDMVRVVQWEVQRSLEVDGDMRHVQWMNVARNEVGGVDMVGLYRAAPEFVDGRPVGRTVRAQRYEIMADPWGRLLYAEVRDVRAPLSAVSPEHAMAADQWPAPQPVNNQLQTAV